MSTNAGRRDQSNVPKVLQPGRLWSLWDMLGLLFGTFHQKLKIVGLQSEILTQKERGKSVSLTIAEVRTNLKALDKEFDHLELLQSKKRAARILRKIDDDNPNYRELAGDLNVLLEVIEDEAEDHVTFFVAPTKAVKLLGNSTLHGFKLDDWEWAEVWREFPDAQDDIEAACICYCVEQNTACVFHMMRVLETGLAELAQAVGRIFEHQQWHNVIEEIESAIAAERKKGGATPEKRDRLKFLSEAAKEFFYFKDGWRNYVSHKRVPYDEHQALSTLEHVRAFMGLLARNLK